MLGGMATEHPTSHPDGDADIGDTEPDPMDAVYDLAQQQRGVIGRFQLESLLGRSATGQLLRGGRLEPVLRGIWRFRGGAEVAEQVAFAAALRARPEALVTGPVVLGLLGIPGFVGAAEFEILTAQHRRLCNVAFGHRVDPAPRRGRASYGAVRVAGPLDALIDTAAFTDGFTDRDLRVAWDHLRYRRLASVAALRGRLERLQDLAPGAAILQRVLDEAGGDRIESEGERQLAPFVGCFEPAFAPQVWVTPGRRVDFFCRHCRYGFEYLGRVDHDCVAQRIADDQRDAELRGEGVRLSYVTKADLDEPVALFGTMTASLMVRAHELGVTPPIVVRTPAL